MPAWAYARAARAEAPPAPRSPGVRGSGLGLGSAPRSPRQLCRWAAPFDESLRAAEAHAERPAVGRLARVGVQ
eukprot:scaffold12659_cov52-Phaeocystis_antarctica.AAC.2